MLELGRLSHARTLVYDGVSPMIERTVLEIQQHRFWSWQRGRSVTPRSQLRETDMLMLAVEECRVRRLPLIPTAIWRRFVQLPVSYTHLTLPTICSV